MVAPAPEKVKLSKQGGKEDRCGRLSVCLGEWRSCGEGATGSIYLC